MKYNGSSPAVVESIKAKVLQNYPEALTEIWRLLQDAKAATGKSR
jgi:hypothetical protein